jgi:hypothetical protein
MQKLKLFDILFENMRLRHLEFNKDYIKFVLSGIHDISEIRRVFGSSWGAYRATNEELLWESNKDYGEHYYRFESIKWPIFGQSYVIDVHLNKEEKRAAVEIKGRESTLMDILLAIEKADEIKIHPKTRKEISNAVF